MLRKINSYTNFHVDIRLSYCVAPYPPDTEDLVTSLSAPRLTGLLTVAGISSSSRGATEESLCPPANKVWYEPEKVDAGLGIAVRGWAPAAAHVAPSEPLSIVALEPAASAEPYDG